jgi:hypothetical protein
MSAHVWLYKLPKKLIDEIDFNNTHQLILATKYNVQFSEWSVRLDSTGRRLSNIINTGKKLTEERLPVIVKASTMKKYFMDESTYFADMLAKMSADGVKKTDYYFSFVVKWKASLDSAIEYIDSVTEDEVVILMI